MNRSHLSKLVAFIVGCLCIYAAYQYNQSSLYQVSGSIYGTSYNITSSKYINDQLNLQIKNELNRIDLIASNYKKASELSALNEHILSDPFTLSNDLKIILNKAIEINQLSPKYDITIGNKINQLGFGPATNVLKNIRTEYKPMQTKFSLSGNQLIKNENFLFDLSSIAKGYAVDQISKILDKNNHNNYLIDIGGELIVRGSKLGNPGSSVFRTHHHLLMMQFLLLSIMTSLIYQLLPRANTEIIILVTMKLYRIPSIQLADNQFKVNL